MVSGAPLAGVIQRKMFLEERVTMPQDTSDNGQDQDLLPPENISSAQIPQCERPTVPNAPPDVKGKQAVVVKTKC